MREKPRTGSPTPSTKEVLTRRGPARVHIHRATGAESTFVLGHGAGRGSDTADLQLIARELPARGATVVLVDQPWVVSGRRVAAPATHLDEAWIDVIAWLRRQRLIRPDRLVIGGRSTGARVACRTAASVDAQVLLLLAFPLAPPSARKDPSKAAKALEVRMREWALIGDRPVVLAQGERDPFGSVAAVSAALTDHRLAAASLVSVSDADHSLVSRGAAVDVAAEQLLAAAVAAVRLL